MMKITIEIMVLGILALMMSLVFIPMLRKIAILIKLVDNPNFRKVHKEPVPLIGGISIGIITLLILLVSSSRIAILKENLPIFISAYILLIVGVIDDKKDLSAKYKLIIQMLLAFVVAFSGTRISSFYGFLGIYELSVSLQYVITILVITGVVNAFNLMDGVDGLVGGLSILGFTMFTLASLFYKDYLLLVISISFIGSLIGFLKFNISNQQKIFMGDGGSLFLGFTLITLGIKLIEKENPANESYAYSFLLITCFFSIPILDSLRVYLGRIKDGNSPFKADKTHLHHLLLKVGFTHKKIALTVVVFALSLFFIGFGLISFLSTTLLILSLMALFTIIIKFILMINSLYNWRDEIKGLEQQ